MNKLSYSFVQPENDNDLYFQSAASSFGVEHITNKDIVSFYLNFSDSSYLDTGLLPVDGSGLLSVRSAGNHTQIAYQHKPGMYYINWGSYEGDPNAANIYVAQPYRIVIADLENGNILGARTFYSPIPITYPQAPLYHVNLPNINCRGYRGNGVGWICLYHNEDISSYPFNEKLMKILERCSGVEAYNDQNMSETDGPRFYRDHNKPRYVWDPQEWQDHSAKMDISWTLDPDLWIPVLVQDMDNQDKHFEDGQPLTFADAILGNYQAYYYDKVIPKPFNKIARKDLQFTSGDVFNIFKQKYNVSAEAGVNLKEHHNTNVLESSLKIKEAKSESFVVVKNVADAYCDNCSEDFNSEEDELIETLDGMTLCEGCSSGAVWVEHMSGYFMDGNDDIYYSDYTGNYYYLPQWNEYDTCDSCGHIYVYDTKNNHHQHHLPIYNVKSEFSDEYEGTICYTCHEYSDESRCIICKLFLPSKNDVELPSVINEETFEIGRACKKCYTTVATKFQKDVTNNAETLAQCCCGTIASAQEFVPFTTKFKTLEFFHSVPGIFKKTIEPSSLLGKLLKDNPEFISQIVGSEEVKNLFYKNNYKISVSTRKFCSGCAVSYEVDPEGYSNNWHDNVENRLYEILHNENETEENSAVLFGTSFDLSSIIF